MHTTGIETAFGTFTASFSERGLVSLVFPRQKGSFARGPISTTLPRNIAKWKETTGAALDDVLNGKPARKLPPLDLQTGTSFQRAVWKVLAQIPTGSTMSYGDVARALGRPGAARAVGQACGRNPIPVLIPCHRVLAAHSQIGGFSGGLDVKTQLLQREGITVQQ